MKKLLFIVLALSCLAAAASAQEVASKASKDKARAHFRQGVTLVREGAYEAALVELKRAYELSPDHRVLFNIGQCQLQLGDYVASIQAFETYLVEGGQDVDPERRASVEAELTELHKRVATLEIRAPESGMVVSVDGVRVGESPLAHDLSVSVGRHEVTGTSPDGRTTTQEVEVAGGDVREVQLALAAEPKREAAPIASHTPRAASDGQGLSRRQRTAIGLLAAGGALGVGALVTGLLARGAHDDHESQLNQPRGNAVAIQQSSDDMKRYALTTDVLAGSAAAFMITGLVLALTSGSDKQAADEDLQVGIAPGRLLVRGRF